jgi:hypothetical protein
MYLRAGDNLDLNAPVCNTQANFVGARLFSRLGELFHMRGAYGPVMSGPWPQERTGKQPGGEERDFTQNPNFRYIVCVQNPI